MSEENLMQAKGTESAENTTKKVRSPFYYTLMIINLSVIQTYFATTDITLTAIIPVIESALGWTPKNKDINLSMSQTAPLVGNLIAAFAYPLIIRNRNPNKIIIICKILYPICMALTIIKNTPLYIFGRFLLGLTLGLQSPTCISMLFQSTYPGHRSRTGNTMSITFSLGIVGGFGVASLVNSGKIPYEMFYLGLAGIGLLDLTCFVFLFRGNNANYYIGRNEDEKARKFLTSYLYPEAAEEVFQELKDSVNIDHNSNTKKIGFFRKYGPELKYAIIFSVLNNFALYYIFTAYCMLLITKDLKDKEESSKSSLFLSIAGFVELSWKFIYTALNLNKKRKKSLSIGVFTLGLLYYALAYLQTQDQWDYCKYLTALFFMNIGFISGCYYSVLPEYFPQVMIGVVSGIDGILRTGIAFSFPIIDIKRNGNKIIQYVTFAMGTTSILCSILMGFILFESYGMKREDVFRYLRRRVPDSEIGNMSRIEEYSSKYVKAK